MGNSDHLKKKKKRHVRSSAKALIIRDNQILLQRCDFGDGVLCYLFPGGGQKFGETLDKTVERECLEEIGARVHAKKLLFIREYISKNHEFAYKDKAHQVEFYFQCELVTEPSWDRAFHPDRVQVGIEWVPLTELEEIKLYPKTLRSRLVDGIEGKQFEYLGDVN